MIKDINDITDQQCVIIYGNDIGKVRQNKIKFLEKIMPDYRTNIGFIDITHTLSKAKPNEDDENIKSDGVLFNEFNTMSLFAPRKVIVLNIP
ncbi:MAG: hypothetical protein LBT02_01495, partial [Rickettsiales bacterium]|nr:hypothetical protein [Rickettsiales bacterium]